MYAFGGKWRSRVKEAVNILLPPACPVCRARTQDVHSLCKACWGRLTFLTEPCCRCCGFPFDYSFGDYSFGDDMQDGGSLCVGCLAAKPAFDWARSALVYDDVARKVILRLKHGRQTHLGPILARLLRHQFDRMVPPQDAVLVPVPLHPSRLRSRRFNQALLIAGHLSRAVGLPVMADGLTRVRATESQGRFGRKKRFRNVAGAFRVSEARGPGLRGRPVILIDDVYTTGATLDSCAKVLRRAGVTEVGALTVARPVDGKGKRDANGT